MRHVPVRCESWSSSNLHRASSSRPPSSTRNMCSRRTMPKKPYQGAPVLHSLHISMIRSTRGRLVRDCGGPYMLDYSWCGNDNKFAKKDNLITFKLSWIKCWHLLIMTRWRAPLFNLDADIWSSHAKGGGLFSYLIKFYMAPYACGVEIVTVTIKASKSTPCC